MSEQETQATLSQPVLLEAETYGTPDPRVVAITAPTSAAAEQYRVLAVRLEQAAQRGIKRIAITSATVGEGRTLTAVNVAIALGKARRNRVTLVDADLRSPSVHQLLGLEPLTGLVDVVRGQTALESTMWRFGDDDLYVLPAGATQDPGATLGARRTGEVLAELSQRSDLVILDAPAVLPTADVQTLGRYIDGAVLVIRAGKTPREMVSMALDALGDIHLVGCVLVGIEQEAGLAYELCAEHDKRMRRALPSPRSTALVPGKAVKERT